MPAAVVAASICLGTVPSAQAAPSDLDPSFSGSGFVLTQFSSPAVAEPSYSSASGVEVQGDGRLVAAGTFSDQFGNNGGFALARYNGDGSLDTGFGAAGRVVTDFPGFNYVHGNAVVLLPDGGIVVGGSALTYATGDVFALARYTSDGSLDPTFGSGGRVAAWLGLYTYGGITDMTRQNDGKLVAVGTFQGPGGENAVGTARYNTDGSLDTTFGSGGLALVTSFYYWESASARAVVVQPDGRILIAAVAAAQVVLMRLNANGSLDGSFGTGGIARLRYGQPFALALQPDGKIIEAGQASGGFSLAVSRTNADGTPDTSFAGDGSAETDFLSFNPVAVYAAALAVGVQANGKVVAAGVGSGNQQYFALARVNADGTLDAGFGNGGRLLTAFPSTIGQDANALALQEDGRIVAAGRAYLANGNQVFALARYLGDPTVPTCNGNLATIVGPAGDSTVSGTPGADVIVDLTGNNRIRAMGGNDTICTGPGNDGINGGGGNDWVDAGDGTNSAEGNGGHDTVITGSGNDELEGNGGNDTLTGGRGADKFRGGDGTDTATDFTPTEGDTKTSVEVLL